MPAPLAWASLTLKLTLAAGAVPGVRFTSGEVPIVTVEVNGKGRVDMLLDTGSTRTVLESSLAEALGIRGPGAASAASVVSTPSGEMRVERVTLDTISLGRLERGPMTVLLGDLRALRRRDPRLDGVLGLYFLSAFHYLIDYESRSLRVWLPSETIELRGGTRLAYRGDERLILLRADNEMWLALDTGAESLVLADPEGLAVRVDSGSEGLARLHSGAGTTFTRTGSVSRLGIGPLVLRDLPVSLLPGNAIPHGLLPARMLGRVYVNHREGYVVLYPR